MHGHDFPYIVIFLTKSKYTTIQIVYKVLPFSNRFQNQKISNLKVLTVTCWKIAIQDAESAAYPNIKLKLNGFMRLMLHETLFPSMYLKFVLAVLLPSHRFEVPKQNGHSVPRVSLPVPVIWVHAQIYSGVFFELNMNILIT